MNHPISESSRAQVRLGATWRVLSGMAYGARQPVMLGELQLQGADTPDAIAAVDAALPRFVSESPPQGSQSNVAVLLAQRVLFWAAAAQRHFNLPAIRAGDVVAAESTAGAAHTVRLAVPYTSPQAAQAALQWAAATIESVLRHAGAGGDAATPDAGVQASWQQQWQQLGETLTPYAMDGGNVLRFLFAADQLDIPVRHVVGNVYCFGQGRHGRWLESSYTERSSVISARIARDKVATAQLLQLAGLPAPQHLRVASPEQAVQAARRLGYPVVVKPADQDQGLGVAADLRDDASVSTAFHAARRVSANILVEKHVAGTDYRLTVLNGRLIKVIVRRPGGVVGDGRSTIAELVATAAATTRLYHRGMNRARTALALDDEALAMLAQQGLAAHSVPAADQFVVLRRTANISSGGTPTLVTTPIHPDNERLAIRAAAALRLDIAGIDVLLPDIARSWMETGGLVCEVNGQPQIGFATTPHIFGDVLRELVGVDCRIPVVLLLAANDTLARQLVAEGTRHGQRWGRASRDGVWLGQEQITPKAASAFAAGQMLAADATLDAAVLRMTPAQIMLQGLPFDRIDAVLLAGADEPGDWSDAEIHTCWQMVLPHVRGPVVHLPQAAACLPPAGISTGEPGVATEVLLAGADVAGDLAERLVARRAGTA